jgi:hypothetical protein
MDWLFETHWCCICMWRRVWFDGKYRSKILKPSHQWRFFGLGWLFLIPHVSHVEVVCSCFVLGWRWWMETFVMW